MGSDVGQIFPTSSLHRDHSIFYALVYEKELSHMGKNNGNPDLVCEKIFIPNTAFDLKGAFTLHGFLISRQSSDVITY